MKNKISIWSPYPYGEAPSQRFRYEQYLSILKEEKWEVQLLPFYSKGLWKVMHHPGAILQKLFGVGFSFLKRYYHLTQVIDAKFVFIHREAAPIGPPFFEFIISKILRKKIIYDFDDAIWLPNYAEANAKIHRLKTYGKVKWICKWAYKVSCGNDYLADWARQYNDQVIVNPTTIDTENLHNPQLYKAPQKDKLTIGWTGTLTTAKYLDFLVPVIQELEKAYDFNFLVISNQKPDLALNSLVYLPWNKSSEIQDLLRMDLGIMPLTDDAWAKGKCGFKALQYMSLGIPAMVSPVGVNTKIVDHGENGWFASELSDWKTILEGVLKDPKSIISKSVTARRTIVNNYSVLSNSKNFNQLFTNENNLF